jgi:hypothetical protein
MMASVQGRRRTLSRRLGASQRRDDERENPRDGRQAGG